MFKKGSKLYSIFNSKCPQCHEGAFFEHPLSFKISKTFETKKHCPSCHLKYMREPSFFYGAMYVGYGLSVAIAVTCYIISYFFLNLNIHQNVLFIILGLVISTPLNLRLSRMIWINIFIHYKERPEDNVS